MIQIKRSACPDVLKTGLTPESKGQRETEDAILFFQDPANHSSKYKKSYTVYKEKTVRELLQKMCYGKCAYCESRITAIYSGDIDHFRPKKHYKWLAADWENLLFACPFCNQTYTHKITKDGKIEEVVQGKLDQFPLLDKAYQLTIEQGNIFLTDVKTYKEAFDREERLRLLIKPCTDENIEACFKYDDHGLILVGDGLEPTTRRKAEKSIEVYALQRLGLVQAREAKVIQIKAQIKRIELAIANLNKHFEGSEVERTYYEGKVREEMQILKRFQDPDQEYAGLARYIIRSYFQHFNTGNFST
jgi:uncharacterized protein (TIGR02646 family)